jgi:hypothetical protein
VEVTSTVTEEAEESTDASMQEGTETPEEEPQEVVNKEYEVKYEANAEGIEEWFLYDHNRGTKQSLADLLAVVRQTQEDEQSAASQLKVYKLLAIIMIAIVIALIIVVTILAFKLRDAYEYEYEDDDEEYSDEDDDDDDEEDDDEEFVVRKPLFRRASKSSGERSASNTEHREEAESQATMSGETETQKKDTAWQPNNFLDMDDDMEFEFLDLK